jgi:hypothetical protein
MATPLLDFDETARDPKSWLSAADRLKSSADALWSLFEDAIREAATGLPEAKLRELRLHPTSTHADVSLMLYGFVVENLLKAQIVKKWLDKGKDVLNVKGRLTKTLTTHKLNELATTAEFGVNENEKMLLARLERHIVWAGRYSVSTFAGKFADRAVISSDRTAIEALIQRLQA